MADQTLTVVNGSKNGVLDCGAHASSKAGDAAGADFFIFANDGHTVLVCVCGAAAKQLTFSAVTNQWGRTETLTPTPTSSGTSVIGPFNTNLFNQTDGTVKYKPAAGGLATDHYLAVRVG